MISLKKSYVGFSSIIIILVIVGLFFVNKHQTTPAASALSDTRTIVDQLGRTVTIPKEPKRIVCLEHHTLDIILELQAGDKLVGVIDKWPNLVSPELGDIYPKLKELPMPGDLTTVNIEALSKLNPDVVLVTHYMDKSVIDKIEKMGIPVVAISLYQAEYEEASKLNPQLKDPDKAYTEGFVTGVTLIGNIVGKEAKAAELIDYTLKNRELVSTRLAGRSKDAKRVTAYMANPDMYTYGTGKYMGVMMERAGTHNVAETINGYSQVTLEQVMQWNPEIIFVQSRYAKLANEIRTSPAWQNIAAVKNGKVLVAPEYTKPWGHPCPESMALGELWLAKTFYPQLFADIDMKQKVNEFYTEFYGVPYTGQL
ncbi:ABC transporter substrate-binding protein [Pelorhabdus rhamnosifermentans]|uniref:ABC transporter substrate-binding protein n=1 Tax=Pelorhabdus rhamnosifermentans TaxID=2772457 RepID=UPI001C062450|nr:ABC transporter substrate-binding protein [Pelorhabdus rhamnosifermentans]